MSAQQVQPRPPQLVQQQPQQHWWAGPLNGIGATFQGMQHNLQQLANNLQKPQPAHRQSQLAEGSSSSGLLSPGTTGPRGSVGQASLAAPAAAAAVAAAAATSSHWSKKQHQTQPVTKEELGRSTWVFLHTLAAQFPEQPTRQQQRDARQLIDSLTRIYPCADCAQHFQEIVRRDPPDVSSGATFSQWMCRVHNTVNRRLGKPTFNCDLVGARWAALDCDEHNSCDMTVGRPR